MIFLDPRLAEFSVESLKAIEMAALRAGQYGDRHIDTLAAIYGLTSLRRGIARTVLHEFRITPTVLDGVYKNLYDGFHCRPRLVEELEFSRDLSSSVKRASEIAEGFESPFVGDEHLLLAIAELHDTEGMKYIRSLGVRPEDLTIRTCLVTAVPDEETDEASTMLMIA